MNFIQNDLVTKLQTNERYPLTDEHPHEECGILGICAPGEDVSRLAYFGLYALQHRGQEAAGIAVSDGQKLDMYKDVGLVSRVFNPSNLADLNGFLGIGHVRYSTFGSSMISNVQPFMIDTRFGTIALGHNGNLVNAGKLRRELMENGIGFSSTSDTEVMTMMLAGADGEDWFEHIRSCMRKWQGAYCLVILTRESIYAVRDPWGFRPLSTGKLPGKGHAVASESGALRTLGCTAIREVQPGEILRLSGEDLTIRQGIPPAEPAALCIFENVYFSRPDSNWDGMNVHQIRQRLGEQLARETRLTADEVIPVPDSSIPAAIGYARASGIPYNDGFIKNRYIGRTFIEPTDSLRKLGVALKFNVINENVEGKRIILIDDSLVRGNTTGALVGLLKEGGAREVHVCITCPPIRHPCFMGVDMGTYEELLAHNMSEEQIRDMIGADSLYYLSLDGLLKAAGRPTGYCTACYTGNYPIDINGALSKTRFEGSRVSNCG
ncbi:MAG: amidophosphoribosyltransferase [Chloroflexi bacterium]|nr:amidophosphoribosyltransferase [Chloroflexota bacterium]